MSVEKTKPVEGIEVSEQVMSKGKVQFMTPAAFSNPAPTKLKLALTVIKYSSTGVITMVGGSDMFSGGQAKIICFVLGVIIIVCGGFEMAFGVKPSEK